MPLTKLFLLLKLGERAWELISSYILHAVLYSYLSDLWVVVFI